MKKIITEPLVSIVVRTCNRPFVLKRALESILHQTYPALEVVVVDDGLYKVNPKFVNEVHKRCSIKTIATDQKGRASAANEGIKHSEGEFIIFLDDDDELYPDHVRLLVDAVMKHQFIVYSDCEMSFERYDEKKDTFTIDRQYVRFSNNFNQGLLFVRNYIPLMTLCFPVNLLEKVGGFDESIDLYEDWDLLLRLAVESDFVHIPEVTAKYRIWSSDQITVAQHAKDNDDYFRVAAKYIKKMTPENLYQLSVYSEDHFNERESYFEQNMRLENENKRLISEVEKLSSKNKSLMSGDNIKLINYKQAADKSELELLQLQRKNKTFQKEREKEALYFEELKRIHRLYVDENLRKEEYIASMEHKMNSLMAKQELL